MHAFKSPSLVYSFCLEIICITNVDICVSLVSISLLRGLIVSIYTIFYVYKILKRLLHFYIYTQQIHLVFKTATRIKLCAHCTLLIPACIKMVSIIPVPLYPFKIRLDYYTVSSFIHLVKFYLSSLTRNQTPESCSCYEQFVIYICILYKHNMYLKRQQKTFIIFGTITCLSNGYFYVRIH